MTLTSRQRAGFMVTAMAVATALSGVPAFGETLSVAKVATQQEGKELINRVEGIGRDMQQTAEHLQIHGTITSLSKETRSGHLGSLKERTNNDLNPAITRLTEIRSELPEWQQNAVDDLLTSAQGIAKGTNMMIQHQRNSSHAMLDTKYKELAAGIVQHTGNLVQTADAAGDYASAYEKAIDADLLNVSED